MAPECNLSINYLLVFIRLCRFLHICMCILIYDHPVSKDAPGQICPLRDDRVMHVAHRAAADPSASQRSDHLKNRSMGLRCVFFLEVKW